MTDQQLLEYEALAGVAADAGLDECAQASVIDALVSEVRRLRAALGYILDKASMENATLGMRLGQCEREAKAALEGGQ